MSVYYVCFGIIAVTITSSVVAQTASVEGEPCYHIKKNISGTCRILLSCKSAFQEVQQQILPQICGLSDTAPIVCCPQEVVGFESQQMGARKNISLCKIGEVVFEDNFENLDTKKWNVEQYVPLKGPNYEFNSYENHPDLVHVKNGRLEIKPQIRSHNLQDLMTSLDFRPGCTSSYPEECVTYPKGPFLNPPVRSGRITSKFGFKYGRIEVRAKLPSGDWIFPEVALTPKARTQKERKIWIAYSRGNKELLGNGDLGGKHLFCGPITSSSEPVRSTYLRSKLDDVPFSEETHIYELTWEPRQITCSVDGQYVGRVDTSDFEGFNSEFQISLGVGVGGINDFPDDVKSGGREKPWKNKDVKQAKKFFEARNTWLATWHEEKTVLKVDWVKLYAI